MAVMSGEAGGMVIPRLDPISVAHEGFGRAVGGETVDVHGGPTDHPVYVDEAVIGSQAGELFFGHLVSSDEAGGVSLSEGDVAGGIFVEESVPEEDTGLRDGGVVRDESDFAELACAFVGGDELVDRGLAGGGGGMDDAAILEGAADVFD